MLQNSRMESRFPRSSSRAGSNGNNEISANSSNDNKFCSVDTSTESTPNCKISRKRKVNCTSPENERSVGSEFESAALNKRKHSRRTPHDPDSPPFDWQSTKQSLKDRATYAFDHELYCDVHFLVGQGLLAKRIPAHKFVLSIGSSVFDAMFSRDWSESKDIEVPDIDPAAFSALLRFLYTDDVSVTADIVMALLYAAKKYAVPSLEDKCRHFLRNNLNPENAFTLLNQARSFDEQDLVESCLRRIDANAHEAFSSDCFSEIDLETLCLVLDGNGIRMDEVSLFKAVCRWSEAEVARRGLPMSPENQHSVLERLLPKIRFPLMTAEEVSLIVAPSELLSDKELVCLYKYFSVKPKPPINFICTPRGFKGRKMIDRFKVFKSEPPRQYDSDVTHSIGFCVDQDVWMKGFGIFGPVDGPAEYDISIELVKTVSGSMLYRDSGTNKMGVIDEVDYNLFSDLVYLEAHTNYTLTLRMKGPRSFYGKGGAEHVTIDLNHGRQATITFNTIESLEMNNGRSSVETGQFPEFVFLF